MKRGIATALIIIAIICFIIGCIAMVEAFDKIENYSYSNKYVGGDAYNYIINGTYFTGYAVIGMGCYIVASITLVGGFLLVCNDSQKRKQSKKSDSLPNL